MTQQLQILKLANQARHMSLAAAQAAEQEPQDLAAVLSYGESAQEALTDMLALVREAAKPS